MKKRILSIFLALVMALSVCTGTAFAASRNTTNEQYIYNFITKNMGLNSAVACGIMASAYVESGFQSDIGSSAGYYGLFQWGGSRKSNLISWCGSNGYDYTTVEGQMHFMQYELTEKNASYYHYSDLAACENSGDGAYNAAYLWLKYYEGVTPEKDSYKESSDGSYHSRMWAAQNIFWPDYANGTTSGGGDTSNGGTVSTKLTISMTGYPTGSIPQEPYDLSGTITPAASISWVQGYVMTADETETVLNSGHKTSLSAVDNSLKFATLDPGYYTLTIVAQSTAGETTTWESPVFAVYNSSSYYYVFTDVSQNAWYCPYVYAAAEKNYVSGDDDHSFRPTEDMTRAEAAVVICRLKGLSVGSAPSAGFKDVKADSWYAPYINAAKNAGLITGDENGNFAPDSPITREELAVMLLRVINVSAAGYKDQACPFNDVPSWHWAYSYVNAAADHGLVDGYSDGSFGLGEEVTRAEAAAMIVAAVD